MTNGMPWKSAIAVLLIFALSTSLSIANADSTIAIQSGQHVSQVAKISDNKDSSSDRKTFKVSLSESLGVADAKHPTVQNQSSQINGRPIAQIQVNLSEKMTVALNENDGSMITVVKQNSEFQTIFDRISGFDRVRTNSKEVANNNTWNGQPNVISNVNAMPNHDLFFAKTIANLGNDLQSSYVQLAGSLGKNISVNLPDSPQIISGGTFVGNEVWKFIHDTLNPNDPIVFLFLLPISGYILVKTENDKIQIYNPRKILSLFFMFIIISSVVATPVSLSPSFIAAAYAAESSQTVDTTTNDTANSNGTNHLGFNQINSTESNNSKLSFNKFSNATNSLSFDNFSNATSVNSNSTLSFNKFSNATNSLSFNNFSNATTSNPTSNIPPATQSWQFTQSTLNSTSVGNTGLDNSTGMPSLQLNGDGYLKQNGTSTANLSTLTLSAWVKPDYSQGSSQFTVVSKGNTFLLAVNNNLPPANKAVFSVFDGIRWDTVTSSSTIPQDWTHLGATFNGTTIAIYVNGKLESSQQISGVPTMALNGQLQTKTVDNLSSNADVLIGAYVGARETPSNLFSGLIDGVQLYGSLLSPAQIYQIYTSNPLSQNSQTVSNSTKLASPPTNSTIIQKPSINSTLSFSQFSNATAILNGTAAVNSTLTNSTNDTAIPVTASIVGTRSSYLITENPEFKFEYFSTANLAKFKKDIRESAGQVQQGGWTGTNGKIKIDVIGPDGSKIPLKSVFQKLRDGKFDIKLGSQRGAKPGLYKVVVTLTRNGQTYTTQEQFYWGLVSANTQKSIYRPGENATFTIVVLDNGGHSVCNSNISMNVLDPSGNTTSLSTGNGITAENQCGLYDASYTTTTAGNYTVGISATSPSGTATFNTSFLAENSYPFDIIRTADSKIDPVDNPNLFNVKIDVTSFTNASNIVIKESVPSVFNVTTDANVQTIGDTKILTWNKGLIDNKTSIQYSYSVPLVFPQLYALGPVEIEYGNQTFTEARQWFVANDPTGTISIDNFQSVINANAGTTLTISNFNVPNNANRMLVIAWASPGGKTISSATWNPGSSQSFVVLSGASKLNTVETQVWYLLNPTAGTGTITITTTKANNAAGVYALSGVQQVAPTANTPSSGSSTAPSTSITTSSSAESMVLDSVAVASTTLGSPTQTQQYETAVGSGAGSGAAGSSYKQNVPASTGTTFTWTSGSAKWADSAIEVKGFVSNTVTLSETLTSADAVSTVHAVTGTLTETLTSADAVNRLQNVTQSLPETLTSADAVSTAHTIAPQVLAETLTFSDSAIPTPPAITPLGVGIAVSGTGSSNTFTVSGVTVPASATNTELVLSVTLSAGTVQTITKPTWSGGGCTFTQAAVKTNTVDAEIWYCKNPTAATSGTVTVKTNNATPFYAANVYVLSGVSQTLNPTVYTSASGSTGTSMSQSIAQANGFDYNIDTFALNAADGSAVAPTASNGETLGWTPLAPGGSLLTGASSYQNPPGTSMGYTWTSSGAKWAWVALDVPHAGFVNTVTLTETLTSADTVSAAHTIPVQTLSESIASADAVNRLQSVTQSLPETLTSADAISRTFVGSRSLSESIASADAVNRLQNVTQSLSESIASADAVSRAQATTKTLAESLTSTDAVNRLQSVTQSLPESLSSADSLSRLQNVTKSLSESLISADAVSTTHILPAQTLAESLTSADALSTTHTIPIQTLSESLTSADAVNRLQSVTQSLPESLTSADAVTRTQTTTQSLSESLTSADAVSRSFVGSRSLSESLTSSDAVSRTFAGSRSLSESLTSSDAVSAAHAVPSQTLSESLTSSDAVSRAYSSTQTLSESLTSTDAVSRVYVTSRSLSESITSSDAVSAAHAVPSQTLSETLTSTDTVNRIQSLTKIVSDSLTSSDTVNRIQSLTKIVSDSLTSSDAVSAAHAVPSQTLSESLTSSDALSTTHTIPIQSLSESLTSSDAVSTIAGITKTVSETLGTSDAITRGFLTTQNLGETLATSESIILKGGINIEARNQNGTLISGATYTISPNPNGGNAPLTVIDGSTNDADNINNGRVVVTLTPLGPYNITMTTIPSGYNVLGNYTIYTVSPTNFNGIALFRVIPISTNLNALPPTVITSAPNLNDTVLDTWKSSFNAREHNGTQPVSQITAVPQLPPIISVGISNSSAISNAVSRQATVQLDTNFTPQDNPVSIIQSLGVPVYSVPKSSDVVSVIPSIVAQSANLNTPTQTVTTPPLDKIVPGQQMIIPVNPSVIPNTGGLKKLDVTSNSSSTSPTNSTSDWFVVKVDNTIPSTIKPLSSSGITDKATLYVNVTYQWEATNPHVGFDWSNPSNFAHPPQLTLQLPKPSADSGIKTDANGCPISNVYLYDPSTKSWTTNTVSIISASPTVGNANTCDVVVQAHHFSQFALGSPGTGGSGNSGTSGTGAAPSAGGGAGSTATGPAEVGASSASATSAGFGGILAQVLNIDSVSYNICQNDTVQILVEYSGDNSPSVILRTSLTGVVQATPASVQPYAQENENSTVQKIVYVAPINPKEQSFEVVALQAAGSNVNSVGQTITITGCEETINFENGQTIQPSQADLAAPQIFDVKLQPGNSTASSADNNQFVNSKSVTISAIISSPTPIDGAKLRFVKAGDPISGYNSVTMDVSPLPITNTTYAVTGTIPQEMLASPAMTYWIDIHNTAQKTTDSDQYTVGIVPQYPVVGNLQMDMVPTRAEGTLSHPTAYFANNSTGAVYGTVSLVVDGNVVYTSPATVFGTGQTAVTMEWKAPTIDQVKDHQVYAQANIYGKPFDTETSPLTSFPSVKTVPITNGTDIESLADGNSTVADPVVLYSSFHNGGTMRYHVTAPDGTCVIGGEDSCLVTKSTFGLRGNFKIVTVGQQTFLVRYSGPDNPLERFSITSSDPIVGKWTVGIDSQSGLLPMAQASSDIFLKVKYLDTDAAPITLQSK